jgi:hypothetical protein
MSPDREGEPDEANITNYPSPGAEGMDAGPFYHTAPRDEPPKHEEQQQQPPQQPPQPQQHQQQLAPPPPPPAQPQHLESHEPHEPHESHEPNVPHEPHEQHEQHVLEQVQVDDHTHAELAPHDPEAAQQHVSRPSNLEELQLAAQLGQGLASTPLLPTADPNMNVEDPNLRSIMPHPEPEPEQQHTPSYVHETSQPDPMVHHGMPPLAPAPLPPPYAIPDGVPPRKRSKVSRACDECRRKKIKCDASSDTGEMPCSSCARSSIRCLFSRVPQKRGPSKGYIKELADRINSIESKLVESEGPLTHDDMERLFGGPRSSSQANAPGPDDSSRKRPFSSISTGDFSTPNAPRQAPWGTDRPLQQTPGTPEGFSTAAYGNGSLAPQPSAIKPDDTPSKQTTAPNAPMDVAMTDSEEPPEIDEGLLHLYLANVQPVFPILPHNKARLQALLAQAPNTLRTAFMMALLAAVNPSSGDVKHASMLVSEWESSDAPRSKAINIVHAQTLLLLLIDADWRASASLPFLLSRAVALANTMRLWRYTSMEMASELDSDDQLCVRIWWSLVLMDRWHAAGSGKPALIPDSSAVAPPGLDNLLGEVSFHLIRLTKLLNRISYVTTTLHAGASTAEPVMAGILSDYIENWREDLPGHIEAASYPLVHMAYWHCRLMVYHLTPGAPPAQILWPTKELSNLLSINSQLRSPLINHFVSLVALSLGRLSKLEDSREEASKVIKDLLEKPAGLWDSVRDRLSDLLRPVSSVEATASQGLQHLADLATAHEGIPPGEEDISFGPSLSSGYLDLQ